MMPTELECLATLNFEINLAVAGHVASKVSYESIKERLRNQLDHLVDDSTFVDVFKFVLERGRGADAPFFNYLKNLYATYVIRRSVNCDSTTSS